MNNLFLLLFFISFISLIIGLIKPSAFSFLKGSITRKKVALLFGASTFIFFVLFGMTAETITPNKQEPQESKVSENEQTNNIENRVTDDATKTIEETLKQTEDQIVAAKKETPPVEKIIKENIPEEAVPATEEPESEPKTQTEREVVLVTLKANASAKWGSDYEMVKYEYDNQAQAYDWVIAQTKYPDIMANAKKEWGYDYEMVKYEYNNQVEAYEWIMAQTAYPDIMNNAKQKWGTDYEMVKYEYNNQVEAYQNL